MEIQMWRWEKRKIFFSVRRLIKYGSGCQPSPTKPQSPVVFCLTQLLQSKLGSQQAYPVGQKTWVDCSPLGLGWRPLFKICIWADIPYLIAWTATRVNGTNFKGTIDYSLVQLPQLPRLEKLVLILKINTFMHPWPQYKQCGNRKCKAARLCVYLWMRWAAAQW